MGPEISYLIDRAKKFQEEKTQEIKKSATVVGTLRYQTVAVEEGANVYSDLHCTNADQKLIDKISKLKQIAKINKITVNPNINIVNIDKIKKIELKIDKILRKEIK